MVHICDARHRQSLQKWKSGCIVVHALASQSSRQEAVCVLRLIDVRNSLYSFMGHCLVMLREACRFCQLFWRWLICVTTFSSLHIPEGDCPLAYRFDGPADTRTASVGICLRTDWEASRRCTEHLWALAALKLCYHQSPSVITQG